MYYYLFDTNNKISGYTKGINLNYHLDLNTFIFHRGKGIAQKDCLEINTEAANKSGIEFKTMINITLEIIPLILV